jgi:hypothetical protein
MISLLNIQVECICLSHHSAPAAHRTFVLDSLTLASTRLALNLHLLVNSGGQHMFLNMDAMSITGGARIHLPIGTAWSLTVLTDLLLFQLEFCAVAIVEISKGNTDSDLHIRPTSLTWLVTEMPTTAEESWERVERIMVLPATTTLLSLLQPSYPYWS